MKRLPGARKRTTLPGPSIQSFVEVPVYTPSKTISWRRSDCPRLVTKRPLDWVTGPLNVSVDAVDDALIRCCPLSVTVPVNVAE